MSRKSVPAPAPAPSPASADEVPLPTIEGFLKAARGPIDARKVHLARMGILPDHAKALRMPDADLE